MANIIIAEDDASIRGIFTKWLKAEGHAITQAADGIDAFSSTLLGDAPDLILSDLMMPQCSGDAFAKSAADHLADVPIVIITASDDDKEIARVEAMPNVKKVVRKPVNREQLLEVVNTMLNAVG